MYGPKGRTTWRNVWHWGALVHKVPDWRLFAILANVYDFGVFGDFFYFLSVYIPRKHVKTSFLCD